MSFKRARAELASAAYSISSDDLLAEDELEQRKKAGEEFRDFLIQRYTDGTFSAADTCLLAHYHSQSGGLGADELALNPRHASRHAAEHLRPYSPTLSNALHSYMGRHFHKTFPDNPSPPSILKGAICERNFQNRMLNGSRFLCNARRAWEGKLYITPQEWPHH